MLRHVAIETFMMSSRIATYRKEILSVTILWGIMLFFVGEALLPQLILLPLDIVLTSWAPWQ